ncbi:hypothetical protein [Escherichia coli]|uniref:hypothetical protein n=1 Tax=Escherichia coli TaxID=562 RepID=UPI0022EA0A7A|nr:hypothetical protein [Escherichia coli]MDA3123906.1 hypothetical protein [Escherichia coli]
MDSKTKGAWIIHHTGKLQKVTSQVSYENTYLSGKAGILLSAISATKDLSVSNDKLLTLAHASNITKFELPYLIDVLEKQDLVEKGKSGIGVLGITNSTILTHTSNIFDSLTPNSKEQSSLVIAEKSSIKPISESELTEEISDLFRLSQNEIKGVMEDSEVIGFTDVEKLDKTNKIYFNGNLFRRDSTQKIKAVLDSLNSDEQSKLKEIELKIKSVACLSVQEVKQKLGEKLFSKVNSIGLFDVNIVSNSSETIGYITLPSAFSKYGNSLIEDAFDLAKAFLSSLTYGMTKSSYARGQISAVELLLQALVDGREVGLVRAIGEDYKVLELKGVVSVREGVRNGRRGPMMKLLKREIGELALQAIKQGDISEQSLPDLPSAVITRYIGPEDNRTDIRRKQLAQNPNDTNEMIQALRTGKGY